MLEWAANIVISQFRISCSAPGEVRGPSEARGPPPTLATGIAVAGISMKSVSPLARSAATTQYLLIRLTGVRGAREAATFQADRYPCYAGNWEQLGPVGTTEDSAVVPRTGFEPVLPA